MLSKLGSVVSLYSCDDKLHHFQFIFIPLGPLLPPRVFIKVASITFLVLDPSESFWLRVGEREPIKIYKTQS